MSTATDLDLDALEALDFEPPCEIPGDDHRHRDECPGNATWLRSRRCPRCPLLLSQMVCEVTRQWYLTKTAPGRHAALTCSSCGETTPLVNWATTFTPLPGGVK